MINTIYTEDLPLSMSDFISNMLNKSWYENNYSQKCQHKFDLENCTESGIAVCSECGKDYNELRSE